MDKIAHFTRALMFSVPNLQNHALRNRASITYNSINRKSISILWTYILLKSVKSFHSVLYKTKFYKIIIKVSGYETYGCCAIGVIPGCYHKTSFCVLHPVTMATVQVMKILSQMRDIKSSTARENISFDADILPATCIHLIFHWNYITTRLPN